MIDPAAIPPILSHPLVLLAIAILGPLLRDVVVALLRDAARRMLGDKDKANDNAAQLLRAAADAIEKVRVPIGLPSKK